ncbi:MAG TPA: hypothetical protein DCP20_02640 [Coriobacteriia bacterium]|nr:MAG: Integral membrane sensor signal transduction histidine kinase [Actinobacteria bacterium 66_15]HAL29599.1 hypothetical protein [Coriobacteriia bacterium]
MASPARKSSVIAPATYIGAGVLIALAAVYSFLSVPMYDDALSDAAYAASYWFGTLLQVLFAVIVITVAVRIGTRQSVGKQWLLIGLGVASFAAGDIIWTIIELHLGKDPYPSLADPFYVLQYGFFLAAVVLAIRSYRQLTPIRTPVIIAGIVTLLVSAAVYAGLLAPYIFPAGTAELGFWGLVVSTLYPLGDVFFMFGPALALALVIRQLGAGRLGWPWWVVALGAFVFAVTDAGYSYADWAGIGLTSTLEMGWIAANLIFAIAALVARDVYRVR